jgi:hypothetical protein
MTLTAVVATVVALCLAVSHRNTAATAPVSHPGARMPEVGAGGIARHAVADQALADLHLRVTPALARAYAAAGALRDGDAHACDHLDQATLAEMAHADDLVALAVAEPGTRVPTRLPDGTVLGTAAEAARPGFDGAGARGVPLAPLAGQPAAASQPDPGQPTVGSSGLAAHEAPAAGTQPPSTATPVPAIPDAAPAAADAGTVAHALVASGRQPSPIQGDLVKQLTAPDAWVAIPYQPAQVGGKPLFIQNVSGAEYAIALYGSDFGSVRLNGGLVVPGRYYRIDGAVRIDSRVPVGVHIRPLTAVGPYYPQPLRIPTADG